MSASEEATPLRGNKLLITLGAMFAGFMAFLDISIVNVGLSDIRASFGTPLDQIAWVSTAYAMANITVIPLSGWLLKRYGFRRYYSASVLIFTAASVCCGLSWNLGSLVFFRIMQGLGGGAIIPTSQSVIFSRYPARQQGMAGALFAIGAITGPLLGPSIGGYLIELSSWHWIFLINVPFGIFAFFVASTQIEEPQFVPVKTKVDLFGIALLAVGMASLQYVLEEGNRDGWFESKTILALSVIAAIALICFVSHELETPHPAVDLRVFKDRGYSAATGLNFLVGTSIFAGSFVFSLYLSTIMHYRALDIGLVFLRGSWVQLFIFPIVGALVSRTDPRRLLFVSFTGIFASLYLNGHLTPQAGTFALVLPVFVRAVGTGFGFVPLTFLAVQSLPEGKRPAGTALFNVTRELGASIGTAVMSTLLDRRSKEFFTAITSHVDIYSPATQEQLAAMAQAPGARLADGYQGALALLQLRISQQALLRAFNEGFLTLAAAVGIGTALVFFIRRPSARAKVDLNDAH